MFGYVLEIGDNLAFSIVVVSALAYFITLVRS